MILFYSFIISATSIYLLLKKLKKMKLSQPIYDLAPENHLKKNGTPTMGGLGFIVVICLFLLLLQWGSYNEKWRICLYLITCIGFGYIGFKDDILKIKLASNQAGLTPKQKLVLQFSISFIISALLYIFNTSTEIILFNNEINLSLIYYVFVPFIIVGFSNAFNLTDGLDGLLSFNAIILFSFISYISFTKNDFLLMNINLLIVGSLMAFLCFNIHPAKIFMGDTGSLVLGALFALDIIFLKIVFVGFVISGFILFEILSVVLQVAYFKFTKKKTGTGKRIFLKAPFHHHLEAKGYSEVKVVLCSSMITLALSIMGIIIL